jgi:hypothetical protein
MAGVNGVRPDRPRHQQGDFARARAEAERAESVERVRAARTVVGNSRNPDDRDRLLSMLGLPGQADAVDDTQVLTRALRTYVRAVADAVGVPPEGTTCEVTDTVTAYLALSRRGFRHPEHDLMLIWSERQGWSVSVETDPTETPVVLSCLGGDAVPDPTAVARFVTESIVHGGTQRRLVAMPAALSRTRLAELMNRRAAGHERGTLRPLRTPTN